MSKSIKPISERLQEEEHDEELTKLLQLVVGNVKRSREKMSENYKKWDNQQDIYKGVRSPDEKDLEARENNEPEKLVVPIAFAQVQTFIAFCMLLYTQNRRFFELMSTGPEDHAYADEAERLLERDLRRNGWYSMLYQLLLDVGRFNLGVVKSWWVTEKQVIPGAPAVETIDVEGVPMPVAGQAVEDTREVISYQGNRLLNVSPYNFFPDTRFPLKDWRRGAFVADESEWHITQLQKWEAEGSVYGIEHVKPMPRDHFDKRGATRLETMVSSMTKGGKSSEDDFIVCLTECQLELVPSKYGLGTGTKSEKYVVQVANDTRIIRVEPLGFLHGEYSYDVALGHPDMHQAIGQSVADMISALQDVESYLVNSRLMSVRKSLDQQLVVDPSGVDMNSVESRSGVILMKKGSPRLGVDKFVRQLQYVDTTASHFNDADIIGKLIQVVTGLNDNAMGQFNGGRRSATEARAVNSGGASRTKITAALVWHGCLAPLGLKMHINQRQGMELETFTKVLGPMAAEKYPAFRPADPAELVGVEDQFVFDSTLQSEKGFIAQSLQELLQAMFTNPLVMQAMPLDIKALMEEMLRLRGVENIERFKLNGPAGTPLQPTIPGGPGAIPGLDPGLPQVGGV